MPYRYFSLRVLLGLGIAAVLTVLLIVYGFIAFDELKTDLMDTAQARIRAQVTPALEKRNLEYSHGEIRRATELAERLGLQGLSVRIYDHNGHILTQHGLIMARALTEETFQPIIGKGQKEIFMIDTISSHRELVYLTVARPYNQPLLLVETRDSLAHVDTSLARDRFWLIVGGLLVLLIALLLTQLVIGLVLRPLTKLANTARDISKGNLAQRADLTVTHDEVGTLVSTFNLMMDRLEEAFAAQQKATDEVKELTANASHELRSHLTVLGGYVDILQRGAAGDAKEQARVLGAISGEFDRLSRLVDDLLTLARLGAGQPLQRQKIDIHPLLNEIVQQALILHPERRITVESMVGLSLLADPDRLRQALDNLIRNALQHTPSKARITLGAEAESRYMRLWVHDTGPGIPPDQLNHVFERFWRADPSRSRNRGSGLGLAIVAAVAEAHEGYTRVESSTSGTTFSIFLPLI
ncbi:MAG: sensor histidine kinase [Chitinophagales bacterium]